MADLTRIFGGQTTGPATIERAPEEQLRDAIADAGLTAPDSIVLDGKLRRFASGTKGKPGMGDKSGWYVAFGDGVPAGSFGDWRSGIVQNWRANMGRPISMLEELSGHSLDNDTQTLVDAELERIRSLPTQPDQHTTQEDSSP